MVEPPPRRTPADPLEQRLDEAVQQVLAAEGLTSRHWQVLHALAFGAMDELDLRNVLGPFGGPVDPGPVLADLAERGWLQRSADGRVGHSSVGAAADARLFGVVVALRHQLGAGSPG